MAKLRNNFDNLPDELIVAIEKKLSPSDKSRFAHTCKRFYYFGFDNSLDGSVFRLFYKSYNTRTYSVSRQMDKLLRHIVMHQIAQAEQMIRQDPGLLLEKGMVENIDGSREEFTPFQLAYSEFDVEMCNMILQLINELPNVNVAQEQLKDKGLDKSPTVTEKFYNLKTVVEAVKKGKGLQPIFENFWQEMKENIVKEGKGYLFQTMKHAAKIYYEMCLDHELDKIQGLKDTVRQFFCIYVIGILQRYSPAWFRRDLAKGISFDIRNLEIIRPAFRLINGETIDPAFDRPYSGLGFTFSVNMFGGTTMLNMPPSDDMYDIYLTKNRYGMLAIKNYCTSKPEFETLGLRPFFYQ